LRVVNQTAVVARGEFGSKRRGSVKAVVRLTPKLRRSVVSMEHGFGSTRYDPLGEAEPQRVGVSGNHLVSNRNLSSFPRCRASMIPVGLEGLTGHS
jgi:anaerobic selenocysteine-containing dehydrogenase